VGYAVAKSLGAGGILTDVLRENDGKGGLDDGARRALARIFSDKALMINEIPGDVDGFAEFWHRLSPLMNDDAPHAKTTDEVLHMLKLQPPGPDDTPAQQSPARRLFDLIRIKNLVSEYMWFLLTGGLVTSIAYNYIVNSACELSAKDMEKRHDEYMAKEAATAKSKEAAPPRVYQSTD
jgi:hypothetical protein